MDDPRSRPLRFLLAALLLVLLAGQAARVAEQVRSDTHDRHTLIRAQAPRLAAGRLQPDLPDAAPLPGVADVCHAVDASAAAPGTPEPRQAVRPFDRPAPALPRAPPVA